MIGKITLKIIFFFPKSGIFARWLAWIWIAERALDISLSFLFVIFFLKPVFFLRKYLN